MAKTKEATATGPNTNGAKPDIELLIPYTAKVKIVGVADLLFHAWNCEAVAEKAGAAKGSKAKKQDNVESYVVRDDRGMIGLPGTYLCGSLANAAKFKQDPRSPRKSAVDLFKAGVVPLTQLASLGKDKWDFDHKARVQVQRQGVTRVRPAFKAGWEAEFELLVNLPEYISPDLLSEVLTAAGRFVGVGDYRPTYGRFRVAKFETITAS